MYFNADRLWKKSANSITAIAVVHWFSLIVIIGISQLNDNKIFQLNTQLRKFLKNRNLFRRSSGFFRCTCIRRYASDFWYWWTGEAGFLHRLTTCCSRAYVGYRNYPRTIHTRDTREKTQEFDFSKWKNRKLWSLLM